jgi:putative ABC transport system permease protein
MQYPGPLSKQYAAFKADLLKNTSIKTIGRSTYVPSDRILSASDAYVLQNGSLQPVKTDLKFITTDYDFMATYGMQMAAGRNFSRAFARDTGNYVINETAAAALGWKTPQSAIGQGLKYGPVLGKVIGVVKDFHFESLHQKIIPLLFMLPSDDAYYGQVSIKIDGRNVQGAIKAIRGTWHTYLPETPFEFTFLDAKFDQLYRSERQQSSLFTLFSFIAIFIACLGLFGLSAFTITQRVKEIGVRKVLGASVPRIVGELSKDFLILVLVATVIGSLVALVAMNKWLSGFAFHINMAWWVFVLAGIIALIIAFATISFQSVKAALANPVKSLRSE